MNTETHSSVLRLIIKPDKNNCQQNKNILNDLLNAISSYVFPLKILIKKDKAFFKIFVECSTNQESHLVQSALLNKRIEGYSLLKIEFCRLDSLQDTQDSFAFWEVEKKNKLKERNQKPFKNKGNRKEEENVFLNANSIFYKEQNFNPSSSFDLKEEEFPKKSKLKQKRFPHFHNFDSNIYTPELVVKNQKILDDDEKIIENKKKMDSSSMELKIKEKEAFDAKEAFEVKEEDWFADSIICPSRVVVLSGLDFLFKGAKEIYNLLSIFGNIKIIIFQKHSQKCFIEYINVESATEAIVNLDKLSIGPIVLSLSYSIYQRIKDNRNLIENSIYLNHEIFKPRNHRYPMNRRVVPVQMSKSLSIRLVGGNVRQQAILLKAVKEQLSPSRFYFVNRNRGRKRLIFEYQDVTSALYILYKFHNATKENVKILLSFSPHNND